MLYFFAIVLAIVGAVVFMIGLLSSSDAEGRGGRYVWLALAGVGIFVLAVGWMLWMAWQFVRAFPFFSV